VSSCLILAIFLIFLLLIVSFNLDKEGKNRLAIAESIDALAAGVTFAVIEGETVPVIFLIGAINFGFSAFSVYLGNRFGERYPSKAELTGGIILIIMRVKILLEHLGVLGG
jgi:putative Mn2+ efflux pump MntP